MIDLTETIRPATWEREFWVLDPGPFINIAFAQGIRNFVFRAAFTESRSMHQNFTKWIDLHARGREWQAIWIPWPGDYVVKFSSKHGWRDHEALWPIWRANRDSYDQLFSMLSAPQVPGSLPTSEFRVEKSDHRPVDVVEGQEHRVVVASMPRGNDWGEVIGNLLRFQQNFTDTTLHLHGQKSFSRTAGVQVRSFDNPVRQAWTDGRPTVALPNGQVWLVGKDKKKNVEPWLRLVGVNPRELNGLDREVLSRKVYEVNLRSLKWAFNNWEKMYDFRQALDDDPDIDSPDEGWSPVIHDIRLRKSKKENAASDRWLCDICSRQLDCPYSREGAVCIVPDSEPEDLASAFKTRNSSQIIDGLGTLMAAQSKRLKRAMEQEIDEDKFNPEVTRMMNSLFKNGVQLAKLVDPMIAGRMNGPGVSITIGNAGAVGSATPQGLIAGVAAEFAKRGIALRDVTPQMMEDLMAEMVPIRGAIETTGRADDGYADED